MPFNVYINAGAVFQSTPPVKAATAGVQLFVSLIEFQSTPPVKAATVKHCRLRLATLHFNPRRP